MKGLKVISYTNVIIIQLIIVYTPFLFTYIGIQAQDFLGLVLYRHTYHALKFKKNISFVLDTAGDLPGAPIDRFLILTIFIK